MQSIRLALPAKDAAQAFAKFMSSTPRKRSDGSAEVRTRESASDAG